MSVLPGIGVVHPGPANTVQFLESDGIFDIFPPTTSLFNLSNDGVSFTMSRTVNGGANAYRMRVARTAGVGSGDVQSFRGKAVPGASTWEAIMGMWVTPFNRGSTGYYRPGLAILQNSSGKCLSIGVDGAGGNPVLAVTYFGGLTTYTSSLGSASVFGGRWPIHFRISLSGTTYTFDYSLDFGDTWVTLATATQGSYFTADRIGLSMQAYWQTNSQTFDTEVFYYKDPDHTP